MASVEKIENMNNVLIPRWPDSWWIFALDNIALWHRRLSIVDLSNHSSQPMIDNRLWLRLVFNWMLYNYKNLKNKLIEQWYKFFSSWDTEVILKSYHYWWKDCVNHFEWMFSFVINNRDTGETFCARDRLWIKPFYYNIDKKRFVFSSSLPSLLKSKDIDTSLDKIALNHYMTLHSIVPAPRTMLNWVKKLPASHTMTIDRYWEIKLERYWHCSNNRSLETEQMNENEWKNELIKLLEKAVKKRLVADLPVWVLLSWWLDSSLIVSLIDKLWHHDLQTFSIWFESVKECWDEFEYSDLISKKFNTKHHKIFVESKRLLSHLPDCIWSMSEPMVSYDNIWFYLLSKEVSKHIKIVQCGQWADEVFWWYSWYPKLMNSNNITNSYAEVFFDINHDEFKKAVNIDYIWEDYSSEFIKEYFWSSWAKSPIDNALQIDTNIMLVDDPVKRVDNMTMAHWIEARVPFLDHELLEFASKIPPEFKIKDWWKYILKQASRWYIPDSIIDRKKWYFPVPALKYIRWPFLDFIQEILSSQKARERNIFNKEYVDILLKDPEKHITPLEVQNYGK